MKHAVSDLLADPFAENADDIATRRIQLLGADFEFASKARPLLQLVTTAYSGLPSQRLTRTAPRIRLKLVLLPKRGSGHGAAPAPVTMISGHAMLGGSDEESNLVVLSPGERSGLIALRSDMLRHLYHARYEYLEFAVFTLAARVQGLIPLHAACIGRDGEGVLLMGPSGSGKSTIALHALMRGMDFLAEDAVFVAPQKMLATGIANYLHLCRESLQWVRRTSLSGHIRDSPMIRRRSGVRKFEVDLRSGPFHLAATPLKLKAVVFLSAQSTGRQPLLRSASKAQLRSQLSSEQPYAATHPEWRTFVKNIGNLGAYVLHRGRHPNEGIDALETLLSGKP